jgi:site-specific recombinase XerD
MTLEHVTTACDLGRVKGVRQPRGRALSRRETARLRAGCAAAPSPAAAARDAAALALLRFAGLRRDELATLRVEKMDMASSEPKIVVRGKGDRDREIPLPTDAVAAIAPWLALRGRQAGPLLLPVRKNGKIVADVDGPMTGNVVYQLLRRAAARTGVAAVAPHDMRRTYISELLDRGADLAVIARLVDHRSVATTQGYDRRGKSAERAAANLLNGDDAADGALSMAKPARETDPERDSDEPEADPVQDPEEAGGPAGGEADPRGAD